MMRGMWKRSRARCAARRNSTTEPATVNATNSAPNSSESVKSWWNKTTKSRRENTLKVKTLQQETQLLTSWECYKYILRGLVEELLEYGGKDELKLMTLQMRSAFLRRMEVAFFNKKYPLLPKLGFRYYNR